MGATRIVVKRYQAERAGSKKQEIVLILRFVKLTDKPKSYHAKAVCLSVNK